MLKSVAYLFVAGFAFLLFTYFADSAYADTAQSAATNPGQSSPKTSGGAVETDLPTD